MEQVTELSLRWYGRASGPYHLVYRGDQAAVADLVQMRAAYMNQTAGDSTASIQGYMQDVGACLEMLHTKLPPGELKNYACWYLHRGYECTYPVKVTSAACEAMLHSIPVGDRSVWERFEFGK